MSAHVCNYCSLRELQEKYAKLGIPIETRADPLVAPEVGLNWPDATGVYRTDTGHEIAWFGSIPEHCLC